MAWYTVKRILWSVPTVLAVTMLGFILLSSAPGDPADHFVTQIFSSGDAGATARLNVLKKEWRHRLGLDLPVFYASLTKWSLPDTVYRISDPYLEKAYLELMDYSGNKEAVASYYQCMASASQTLGRLAGHSKTNEAAFHHALQALQNSLGALPFQPDPAAIRRMLLQDSVLASALTGGSDMQHALANVSVAFRHVENNTTVYQNYIPKIVWHGLHNQYHQWLFGGGPSRGLVRGDFGTSYIKKVPVMEIIKDKLPWSLFFSLASVLLAYLVSIPLGSRMAMKPGSSFTKISQRILFFLYAIPPFFMGVLLLMLFANPDVLALFPPSGISPLGGYDSDAGFFEKAGGALPYTVLPMICYVYASLAFLSGLTAASIGQQWPLDYIKTARAKGLDLKTVVRKHALKNSLLPLITVFANIFPALLGGSVVIETVFTIPGMGAETVKAVYAQDYPLVIAVLTLSGILTVIGYLVSDLLYALVDPRIRLHQTSKN